MLIKITIFIWINVTHSVLSPEGIKYIALLRILGNVLRSLLGILLGNLLGNLALANKLKDTFKGLKFQSITRSEICQNHYSLDIKRIFI